MPEQPQQPGRPKKQKRAKRSRRKAGIVITLSLSPAMLRRIDAVARKEYNSRSEFIRVTMAERLRQLDNPGLWPNVPTGKFEIEEFFNEVRYKRNLIMIAAERRERARAMRRERPGEYPASWQIQERINRGDE